MTVEGTASKTTKKNKVPVEEDAGSLCISAWTTPQVKAASSICPGPVGMEESTILLE